MNVFEFLETFSEGQIIGAANMARKIKKLLENDNLTYLALEAELNKIADKALKKEKKYYRSMGQ